MATWIVLAGVIIVTLILVGAVLVVMIATRERAEPVRLPGIDGIINREPDGRSDHDPADPAGPD